MQVSLTHPKNNLPSLEMRWGHAGLELSGAWLAEALRLECSTQFAQALENEEKKSGFSKTLSFNSLERRLNVEETDALREQLKASFETLVSLQDFGHLSSGKGYIPRESRVTMFTRKWGRISGGLPDSHNECPDDKGIQGISGTIGRLALLPKLLYTPASWEVKQTYDWELDQCKADIKGIEDLLATPEILSQIELEYYQTKYPPRVPRFKCWGVSHPGRHVNVARTRSDQQRKYYLVNSSTANVMGVSISRDKAMLYLLFLDLQHHRPIYCDVDQIGEFYILKVPKYLPSDWIYALKAASRDYADAKSCIEYTLSHQSLSFTHELLTAIGCQLSKNYV